jgi:RNA polymerase sigma-70 factor (ECF subfamily)
MMSAMTDAARTLRPEELLAETEWLRALALHLVRDPGAAEDAAQETSIAALRSPPAGERRPWLAQVLRNFTRQRHRAESRRARREETAVARAREARPDEVVERVETHRLLAELVASLSEPNRTAVAMRYYDDLTPSEIAARLGVPAGTVRARIHRGLAELRERLDERHRSDREAWIAALAPLAYGGRSRIGRATATGARTTSATTALVAATLVAAVAVVGVVIKLSSSSGEAPAPAGTTAAAHETQGALARRVRSADGEPPTPEPPPRGDVVRLAGTVLDPTGAPVRDAVVVANPVREPHDTWDWFAASDDAQHRAPPRRVVSSAGGGFALDATKGGRVAVSATALGFASVAVRVDADADSSDLVLRLAPALGLAGDVWDEAARPIAGAVVVVQRGANDVATVVTDDGGRFDVPALAPVPQAYGGETGLLVSARDFAPVRLGVSLGGGRIRVVLPRGQFVAGRVIRDDGSAVAGAAVTIQPVSPSLPAPVSGRTDESGAFRIGRVGATGRFAFDVHVVAPGFGRHVVSSLVAPASQPFEIRLPRTVPLRGRVADADGNGLAGVRVAVRESLWWTAADFNGGEGTHPVQRTVVSGTDGGFEIACSATADQATVGVDPDDPSWRSDALEFVPKETPPDSKSFEVRATRRDDTTTPRIGTPDPPPIDEMTGRVEDASGRGVAGALVAVGLADGALTALTDGEGVWRLRNVPGRGGNVSAWADGYVAVRTGQPLYARSARVPAIVLLPGGPLAGAVADDAGAPVAGALVRVNVDTGKGWAFGETRSDSAGAFTIACVPAGKGRVWVTPGRADVAPANAEFVSPCESLRVTLPRGLSIAGRAVHADGSPIASAYLTWCRESGGPQDDTRGHQVTDADGRFEIAGVPQGRYRIDVSRFVRVRVAAGTTDLEMRAGPPRAIAGRVEMPSGADPKKASVSFARDDGPPGERGVMFMTEWAYASSLDAEGRFRLADVCDGTYAVYVDGVPGVASAVVRGVKPGDEDVEVRTVAAREIAGLLVDADGRPVAGSLTVKPASGFGPVAWARSGAEGSFRVNVPFDGDGVVEAWANDNTAVRSNATLPASGELRIEVTPKR